MTEAGIARRDEVARQVSRVVADVLGVEPGEIGPSVSLVDDLAADSLDLVDIGLALEVALGVSMPDQVLEGVRTYDDLLAVVWRQRRRDAAPIAVPVEAARSRSDGVLERAGRVTSFLTETLTRPADAAGRSAPGDALPPEGVVAALERTFGRLRALGAIVSLAREQRPAPDHRSGQSEKEPRAVRAPG